MLEDPKHREIEFIKVLVDNEYFLEHELGVNCLPGRLIEARRLTAHLMRDTLRLSWSKITQGLYAEHPAGLRMVRTSEKQLLRDPKYAACYTKLKNLVLATSSEAK